MVKVRKQTRFLDLSCGTATWATEAIRALGESDATTRSKAYFDTQAAGFDIKDTADWLSNFYLNHFIF